MKFIALFGAAFSGVLAFLCTLALGAMCVGGEGNEAGLILIFGVPLWWVAYKLYSVRNDV
jgi:hypothetical protein